VSSVAATLGVAAALGRADEAAAPDTTSLAAGAVASATSNRVTATSSAPAASGTARSSGYADGIYTGPAENTRWGDVQVQVTIESGKIVSVTESQAPDDRKSVTINARAQPVLEAEAIAAQSADISAVSGATYTRRTYTASLQGALDQASQATTPAG
jgi:uncharacterized protein with FMN-binding domain